MTRRTPYRLAFALALVLVVAMGSQRVVEVEAHGGDSFAFTQATYNVLEGAGTSHNIRIERTNTGPGGPDGHGIVITAGAAGDTATLGVHYSLPQPYEPAMDAGQTLLHVQVSISDEPGPNIDRTFTLKIASVGQDGVIGAVDEALVTILDDESLPPEITSITPTSGSTLGGTVVQINGSGFTGVNCASPGTAVTFGGTPATACTVTSNFIMSATAPAHGAGTVDIVVTHPDNGASTATPGTANDFLYVTPGAPTVSSVSPASGPVGQAVVILGTGFTGATAVQFDGINATSFTVSSPTRIDAVAPAPGSSNRPLTVDVTVTANAMTSTVTTNSKYTYAALTVASLTPSSGPAGTVVVITGTGFTTDATVEFNGIEADIQSSTTTTITVVAPAVPGTVPFLTDVIVKVGLNSSQNTVNDNFQYVGVTLTSLTPVAGPPGTVVTISGSGFRGTPTVKFGTTTATTVTEVSDTSLKVVAPPHAAGKVDVTVQSGNVIAPAPADATKDDFTYTAGVEVTSVSPVKGPTAGGNTVTITGSGFAPTGGATVTVLFGATPGTVVTVTSNTQLTVVAPARPAGTISIKVTVNSVSNPDTDGDDYTYADLPVITSLTPSTSVAGQTTIVKITGLHFTTASKVAFGNLESVFTINAAGTEITAATPSAAAAGTVDVFVTNPAGTSVAGPQTQYTFTGTGGNPAVTALSPSSAPINTSGVEVTITGVNFAQGATVRFGTEPATGVQVLTSTSIKAIAPLRTTTGTVDVTVTTGAGTSSTAGSGNDFTYGNPSGSTLTVTYTLYVRFTLITWDGKDNIAVGDALRGLETPTDLPATNNVTSSTSAVFMWSANGAGCTGGGACWLGYFPSGVGVPGANNLQLLVRGFAYWVAVTTQTSWTTRQGP